MIRSTIILLGGVIVVQAHIIKLQAQEINPYWITEIQSSENTHKQEVISDKTVTTGSLGDKHLLDGIASYYWQDLYTASGEIFDKRAMTAAHPTLPFGTVVEVTNLGNGRSARVRINDRGPYVPGRVIDVSEAAAEALDMRNRGLAPVRINIITASAEKP